MPTQTTKQIINAGQKEVDKFLSDKFLRLFDASAEDNAQWKLARANAQEFLRANKIKLPAGFEIGFTEEPKIPEEFKELLPTKKLILRCFWIKKIVYKILPGGQKLPIVLYQRICRLVFL